MNAMPRGSVPSETVRRIQESIDIVDVVSPYLTLRKRGQNYVGLCPFHQEKTPSFVVSPSKQLFHCFGCGAGGDVFGFLMKADSLSFPEAIRILGEKAGISITPLTSPVDKPEVASSNEFLFKIHEETAAYYHHLLLNHPTAKTARGYLQTRGVHEETVKNFMLGYALPLWDGLVKHLQERGWTSDQVEKAGLSVLRQDGTGHYDRFRDRLIFPIRNLRGKVIAFGGRILPSSQAGKDTTETGPKYMNSPETQIYTKGQHLYALDKARAAVSQSGSLVVVEGYLDALAAHQAGVQNVVATLGTALTGEHLHLVRRFTHKVILVFDPDLAGVRAALRTVELFIDSGIQAQVVMLPEGEDPDSFIKNHGAAAFKELLCNPVSLLDFALQQMVGKASRKTIEEKLQIIEGILPVLAKIQNHVERSHYLKRVADELGVHERDLGQELVHHVKKSKKLPKQEPVFTPKAPQFPVEERMLIQLLLQGKVKPGALEGRVQPEDFTHPRLGLLFSLILETARGENEVLTRQLLLATQDDSEMNLLISAWSLQELTCEEYEKTVHDCLQKLYSKRLNDELRQMEEKIRKAEGEADGETVRALQQGVLSLKRQILSGQQN
jgi:DNA primase